MLVSQDNEAGQQQSPVVDASTDASSDKMHARVNVQNAPKQSSKKGGLFVKPRNVKLNEMFILQTLKN